MIVRIQGARKNTTANYDEIARKSFLLVPLKSLSLTILQFVQCKLNFLNKIPRKFTCKWCMVPDWKSTSLQLLDKTCFAHCSLKKKLLLASIFLRNQWNSVL